LYRFPGKNYFITAIIGNSMLAIIAILAAGCKCTAVSSHEWAGHFPPAIHQPEDIVRNLLPEINGPVKPAGETFGILTTPFKRLGIFGWRDLGYDGEATGRVLRAARSTDQFYTVDMALETLSIDGRQMSLNGHRYLRAELCLCEVKLPYPDRPRAGDVVWIRGRMVWDGDGFVEIHPRHSDDVKKEARQFQTAGFNR
jgi:hypothetical protein